MIGRLVALAPLNFDRKGGGVFLTGEFHSRFVRDCHVLTRYVFEIWNQSDARPFLLVSHRLEERKQIQQTRQSA
jgi:hypothetical protein